MTQYTKNQILTLRAIQTDGYSNGAATRTLSSLEWNHRLIERATIGNPHPTNPDACWRLTEAGTQTLTKYEGRW